MTMNRREKIRFGASFAWHCLKNPGLLVLVWAAGVAWLLSLPRRLGDEGTSALQPWPAEAKLAEGFVDDNET